MNARQLTALAEVEAQTVMLLADVCILQTGLEVILAEVAEARKSGGPKPRIDFPNGPWAAGRRRPS